MILFGHLCTFRDICHISKTGKSILGTWKEGEDAEGHENSTWTRRNNVGTHLQLSILGQIGVNEIILCGFGIITLPMRL